MFCVEEVLCLYDVLKMFENILYIYKAERLCMKVWQKCKKSYDKNVIMLL
jgi:hypothetical protein